MPYFMHTVQSMCNYRLLIDYYIWIYMRNFVMLWSQHHCVEWGGGLANQNENPRGVKQIVVCLLFISMISISV